MQERKWGCAGEFGNIVGGCGRLWEILQGGGKEAQVPSLPQGLGTHPALPLAQVSTVR